MRRVYTITSVLVAKLTLSSAFVPPRSKIQPPRAHAGPSRYQTSYDSPVFPRRKRTRTIIRQNHWQSIKSLRRRLDTAEDKFDVHKISSIIYIAATFHILIVGTCDGFSSIPISLQASTYCFLVTSVVQGITSIHMAMKYRRNDRIVRMGFVNMSLNMVSLGWAAYAGSPFASNQLSEPVANEITLMTLVPVCCLTFNELVTMSDRIKHRKKRRKEPGGDMGAIGDALSYGLITVAGFVASLAGIVILSDPSHDSAWLEQTFAASDADYGLVGVHTYYSGILTSFAVAIGALCITLRDRKIVSKQTEQLMLGVPTVLFVMFQLKALNIV